MNREKTDRFFIPIAEEYIKSGMLDEAIAVLKDGLKTYPNYLGARVSLGKAYLEKKMIPEALKEFEYVVQQSPDNYFAHRKLASLYRDLGRIDDAIKACETLLVFNPKDQEIAESLSDLMSEKMEKAPPAEEISGKKGTSVEGNQVNTCIDFTSAWEVDQGVVNEDAQVVDELITETMGDLYISQGEIDKGADIFKRILEKEPDNESVKDKLISSIEGTTGSRREKKIKDLQEFLERVQRNKRMK